MANTITTAANLQYVTIDTAPGSGGYWTNPVSMRVERITKMNFSIRGTGVMTPILQFKCYGDTDWTDYSNNETDFVVGDRGLIEGDGSFVEWRAGVKEGGYTSGSCTMGFDW